MSTTSVKLASKLTRYFNWPLWLTLSLVFVIFAGRCAISLDPDFGWHIRNGEYFTEHGIQQVEPFTFTASDFPYISHEPISDILVYHLHLIGGYQLLVIVFAALWTLSIWLIMKLSRFKIPGWMIIIAVLGVFPFTGIRTLTWSILGFAILLNLLSSRQSSYFTPLLFMVWANFHGSFVVGLAYLAYSSIYAYFLSSKNAPPAKKSSASSSSSSPTKPKPKLSRERSLKAFFSNRDHKTLARDLLLLLVCVISSFINPYGFEIYREIFSTLFDTTLKWTIQEWMIGLPIEVIPYLFIFALSAIFDLHRWKLRDYLHPVNILLLAGLTTMRHWPLFIIASLPVTLTRFSDHILPLFHQAKTNAPLRKILITVGILFLSFTFYAIYTTIPTNWNRERSYPSESVAHLSEYPCSGNLFNEYNIGGYLIWRLPSHKVYIDGRGPSWQHNGTSYMRDYQRILSDPDFRAQQFSQHNITCALLYTDNDLAQELIDSGWQTTLTDNRGFTLLKQP